MGTKDCYKIGFVMKPHGLKGEVTAALDPDLPNDPAGLKTVFLDINGAMVPYFIESLSVKGDKAFIKFEDIDSIDDAVDLVRKSMFLPLSERPGSGRGEFYDDEVVGFSVVDQNLGALGQVKEVMNAGLNRLLVLGHNDGEVLIPVNSPFIVSLNKGKKLFTVNLPDGFLDI
jgi:16S rRNA processing protein RimM